MAQLPEEVFDEFFRQLGAEDQRIYRGRKDLSVVPEATRTILIAMRDQFNAALRNEKKIAQSADPPQFHFDYVDSDVSNALAFLHKGYSFVGITIPLLDELVATSKKLCGSEAIVSILMPRGASGDDLRALFATLIRIQLLFAMSHEYTHHANGHMIPPGSGSVFSSEITDSGETGNLDQQVCEIDADGCAALRVLSDLIDGSSRALVVGALKLDTDPTGVQDQALFRCFIVAAGAFLFARKPLVLNNARIYEFTHPPQSLRMMFLMRFAAEWCGQSRPGLETSISEGRFHALMDAIGQAIWGTNNLTGWGAQIEFLASEAGSEYFDKLDARLKHHVSIPIVDG